MANHSMFSFGVCVLFRFTLGRNQILLSRIALSSHRQCVLRRHRRPISIARPFNRRLSFMIICTVRPSYRLHERVLVVLASDRLHFVL